VSRFEVRIPTFKLIDHPRGDGLQGHLNLVRMAFGFSFSNPPFAAAASSSYVKFIVHLLMRR